MKTTAQERVSLQRVKLIRALQVIQHAYKTGRISDKSYEKLHHQYLEKLREVQGKQEVEQGMLYSHLELPPEITAQTGEREQKQERQPYDIFGGIVPKIIIGLLVYFLLAYCIQYICQQRHLAYAAIAFLCPLLYLFIVYLFDRYEPEPKIFVLGAFVWGMLAGVLSLWINNCLYTSLRDFWGLTLATTILLCGAGVTEEFFKGIGLYRLSKHPQYNDTLDGILYGMAVGLGFAAFENLIYFANFAEIYRIGMVSEMQFQMSVWLRSTLSALGHAVFTGVLSLMLARAKLRQGLPSIADFIYAYVVAAILHGTFNGIVRFAPQIAVPAIGIMILCCLLYFWVAVRINWGNQRSWQSYKIND